MDKKEVEDMLENMTVEELFKLLSKTDRDYIRGYIERAVLKAASRSEGAEGPLRRRKGAEVAGG